MLQVERTLANNFCQISRRFGNNDIKTYAGLLRGQDQSESLAHLTSEHQYCKEWSSQMKDPFQPSGLILRGNPEGSSTNLAFSGHFSDKMDL